MEKNCKVYVWLFTTCESTIMPLFVQHQTQTDKLEKRNFSATHDGWSFAFHCGGNYGSEKACAYPMFWYDTGFGWKESWWKCSCGILPDFVSD